MKQKILKVAVNTSPYVIEFKKELGRKQELIGYEGKYLQLILDALDFDFQLISPPDNEIGRKKMDGNWTGVIGMVDRGEADLSICSIMITSQRAEAVDFSIPYTVTGITFAVKKPQSEFSDFAYLYPFGVSTWLLICLNLVLMSSLFFVILRQRISFSRIFLSTFGSFCHQPMILSKDQKNWNWIFGLWMLFVFFLSLSYSCCLLSFLSIPFEQDAIKTFQQLSVAVQKGTHRVHPPKGSSIINYLATSELEYLRVIGKEINRNNWFFEVKDAAPSSNTPSDFVRLDTRQHLAFYYDGSKSKGDYVISIEDIAISSIGFAFRKNCSFAKKLNNIISRTTDAGLFDHLVKIESLKLPSDIHYEASESKTKPLSMSNTTGIFFLFWIGIFCSIVVLIFEIIYPNFFKFKKIMK